MQITAVGDFCKHQDERLHGHLVRMESGNWDSCTLFLYLPLNCSVTLSDASRQKTNYSQNQSDFF